MSQDVNHYDLVIADLEAKRDQLNATIQALMQMRGLGDVTAPTLKVGATSKASNEQEISHDTFFQMTIPDAARKYLSIVKRTKTMSEIIEAILRGGLKSSAKDVNNTFRSIISRDDTFVRVNGEWGLTEWYPAMRRDAKKVKATPGPKTQEAKPARDTGSGVTLKERVLACLSIDPTVTMSPGEIAKSTGIATDTVRAALSSLLRHGKVDRPEQGLYIVRPSDARDGVA